MQPLNIMKKIRVLLQVRKSRIFICTELIVPFYHHHLHIQILCILYTHNPHAALLFISLFLTVSFV